MKSDVQLIEESECFPEWRLPDKREKGKTYANVLIASCKSPMWWYRDLVGMEMFCQIRFRYGTSIIEEVMAVRLTKTTILKGNSLHAEDIILI